MILYKGCIIKRFLATFTTQRFALLKEHKEIALIINALLKYIPYINILLCRLRYLELESSNNNFCTKLQIICIRMFFGMCASFIFWLPFFSFILAQILPHWGYYSLICIVVGLLFYCGYTLYNQAHSTHTSQIQVSHNKTTNLLSACMQKLNYRNIFFLYFWFFLSLCIGLFSFMHNNLYILTSLFYPISISIFFFFPRTYRFWFGFFIGIFGFYWLSLSSRFALDSSIAVLPITLCVGIIYGIFFLLLFFFNNILFRIIAMCILFVIYPLEFNWLNLAYFSAYSVFQASLLGLICLSCSIYLACLQSRLRYLSIFLILLSFDYNFNIQSPQLHAKIVQTNYPQDIKWSSQHIDTIIEHNFQEIQNAINEGYPIVILPETSFPLAINMHQEIYQQLLEMSKQIIIFIGGMRLQEELDSNTSRLNAADIFTPSSYISLDKIMQQNFNNTNILNFESNYINIPNTQSGYYNTTFIFANTKVIVADKIVLVPFGETLPFNSFTEPIYKNIFGESFGFNIGREIPIMHYKGLKIFNANCYEGTMELPYKHDAKYIIMESNNAWFVPSTQPFMQQMIMKYYARAYDTFVYHATNLSPKAIITPNNGMDFNM